MANNQAFNSIQANKLRRSKFDLSHTKKLTCNMGDLVPIFLQDVLPGDTFQVNSEVLLRMMPLVAPIYHNVNIFVHYFFVPNRLVWSDWEDFITGGVDGMQTPSFPRFKRTSTVTVASIYMNPGSLADFLGIPVCQFPQTGSVVTIPEMCSFSQLPFRAYQLIYNEYFRDQTLNNEVDIRASSSGSTEISGTAILELLKLRKRSWERDYFTSALPWTQRGQQMNIPLTGNAPVIAGSTGLDYVYLGNPTGSPDNFDLRSDGAKDDQLYANLTTVNTTSINDLRQAFQIQKWLERSARSGSRYVEQLLSFFGVRSSDARLQRPEFLGGGKIPIAISEVLQTSETQTTPLAEFAGHGISYGTSNRFRRFFEEHGQVLGIMSILPRTGYMQGLSRHLRKFDKYDYYWPEFAHLGEQDIRESEIYYDPAAATDKTFGYTARYNEYRYVPDTVHGDMLPTRDTVGGTVKDNLSYWHLGRYFTQKPVLNGDFVASNPSHRIFAVTDPTKAKLVVQDHNRFTALRPVAKYGEPGGI